MLNYKARLLRNRCQIAARVGSLALVRGNGVETTRAGVRANVADPVTDATVKSVVEKFGEKYGAKMCGSTVRSSMCPGPNGSSHPCIGKCFEPVALFL